MVRHLSAGNGKTYCGRTIDLFINTTERFNRKYRKCKKCVGLYDAKFKYEK